MNKISTDEKKIEKLLSRGVEEVIVHEDLEKELKSGRKLRVKLGFDPTGAKIHIGRAIILKKLREFQELGHKVVFIVGDFTAKIGDPSDKLSKRPMLTEKQIKENLKSYEKQVEKIIDLSQAEWRFNSDWLKKLNTGEIAELAESFSVQQMIARRNFKERWEKKEEISLREMLYPLFQGYDSVAVKADVEIGGFDQLFNLKAGRVIQKHYGMKEQNVLTTSMLIGTDGQKMSTSFGNVINITDEPKEMFGKIMSILDELIEKYFLLCTDLEEKEIKEIKKGIEGGKLNPKDAKVRLGEEIVKIYHGEKAAREAKGEFERVFSKKELPKEIPEVKIEGVSKDLVWVLIKSGIAKSKSEAWRLIKQGGVKVNDEKEENPKRQIFKGDVIKVGPRHFVKVI
ncbi:MAG: tyrosine--tRNA ligase [Candidatus Liptonbacteria bacterium RIFOXYC1_FULL_36_8]|uniref:Tyrosine--tRNA ligase n=3 Tax=Candidatus Liptoniibacteriota TaxID=1817909 RepID=A0A1G2CLA1_9BACT|nr:MAG: tyrosine--tRNA ligase [Candidatus Liptonbacteria bacterium RIFOXYB1_FULL_36_10]OGZ03596.1 MAG: tyrosine--tRNA ligase [Candidatus Liptonbacteria bacterium RIFOXYD1_FULL_36_11]OGZ03603.1 MAG: tyrosine--tRNA ligase [Candidatus Liptonbacteria bacterium RIFOXYC1_FULL_36_8]